MASLPPDFPFADIIGSFIREFRRCRTYWYVPKTRALTQANLEPIRAMTRIIGEEFADREWNRDTQDAILVRSREVEVLAPYKNGTLEDRTALVRIWKVLLQILGLVWIRDGRYPVLTEAGTQFLRSGDRLVLAGQIAKYQYPNPSLRTDYANFFKGLTPHLFILQAMRQTGYQISVEEYGLFVNLARGHDDLQRIVRYIQTWRDLRGEEQQQVFAILRSTASGRRRIRRVEQGSSYQRAFFSVAGYITAESKDGVSYLTAPSQDEVNKIVEESSSDLKITRFKNEADWFAYYGNPKYHPSWFTYVKEEIESASTSRQARAITRANRQQLTESQIEEIEHLEIEKGIEEFYAPRVSMLEPGLRLIPKGRQYSTPVGRIDLLCKAANGDYVVVEIKAAEAGDAVFGQILRYIGWVHRNFDQSTVRGIILASGFPETARYSRIGLLKPDAEKFIQFRQHGLNATHT